MELKSAFVIVGEEPKILVNVAELLSIVIVWGVELEVVVYVHL